MKFYSFDLDFDLVTLILKLDLDIIKMSLCTKNEVPTFRQTDRQTHKQQTDSTENITYRKRGW